MCNNMTSLHTKFKILMDLNIAASHTHYHIMSRVSTAIVAAIVAVGVQIK